jgi:hypothetical protein
MISVQQIAPADPSGEQLFSVSLKGAELEPWLVDEYIKEISSGHYFVTLLPWSPGFNQFLWYPESEEYRHPPPRWPFEAAYEELAQLRNTVARVRAQMDELEGPSKRIATQRTVTLAFPGASRTVFADFLAPTHPEVAIAVRLRSEDLSAVFEFLKARRSK